MFLLFIGLYLEEEVEMAKKRITLNLNTDLIEEARDAVVWLQSKGERITLSDLVAEGLGRVIEHKKIISKVSRIPKRKRELNKGRLIM